MEQKKNQEWISTLRGIAMLLVFCSHLPSSGGESLKFVIGRIGVVIFFLFSGYLTVESRSKRNRKQYIFNRLLRMYPVYWLLLMLTFVVNNALYPQNLIEIKALLANFTLFHQFIGYKEILGASWMMPIQVCFFMLIGMMGVSVFQREYWLGKLRIDIKTVTIIVLMACTTVVGYVRHITGIPFPTAFFLLMAVAFMGLNFNIERKNGGGKGSSIIRFAIFQVGLLISAYLSYGEAMMAYEIAYNIGIALFFIAYHMKLENNELSRLSKLGFAFFLGADIPMYIVRYYIDFFVSFVMQVIGWIINFILAFILAWMITKYIEKPMLVWGKTVEMKLDKQD